MGFFSSPKFDFLAIGDIVVDNFIRLAEAEIETKTPQSQLCLAYGQKIPYTSAQEITAVGNAPNAAVAAAHLGLASALCTNLGADTNGEKCLDTLRQAGVAERFVTIHPKLPTNYHFVLWYQDDRTILIKHEKYPYKLPNLGEPTWVYLSSLGEHSLPFHEEILKWLEANPKIKLAFQPGTYQIRFGPLRLAKLFKRTTSFFCNREEARQILETKDNEPRHLAERLADLGPRLVVITDGPAGAYIYLAKTKEFWFMPIFPDPAPPVSRTGAGDAFAATVTACTVLGYSLEDSLKRAMINSMSVVQHVGAQTGLLTLAKIEKILATAPADFQPRKI